MLIRGAIEASPVVAARRTGSYLPRSTPCCRASSKRSRVVAALKRTLARQAPRVDLGARRSSARQSPTRREVCLNIMRFNCAAAAQLVCAAHSLVLCSWRARFLWRSTFGRGVRLQPDRVQERVIATEVRGIDGESFRGLHQTLSNVVSRRVSVSQIQNREPVSWSSSLATWTNVQQAFTDRDRHFFVPTARQVVNP